MSDREYLLNKKAGHGSPWGEIQDIERVGNGLRLISTATHGGILVHPELAKKYIPAKIWLSSFLHSPHWFEEDCDWVIPFALIPEEFFDVTLESVRHNRRIAKTMFEQWKKRNGIEVAA